MFWTLYLFNPLKIYNSFSRILRKKSEISGPSKLFLSKFYWSMVTTNTVLVEGVQQRKWTIPVYICIHFLFFPFLKPHPQHMKVPRLGLKSELQLPAYTTATAIQDQNHVCDLHHSSWQCQILHPLSKARDRTHTSSWILVWVNYNWATMGNPICVYIYIFFQIMFQYRLSQNVGFPELYISSLLPIDFVHRSLYKLFLTSHSNPPFNVSHLITISLISKALNLLLFCE